MERFDNTMKMRSLVRGPSRGLRRLKRRLIKRVALVSVSLVQEEDRQAGTLPLDRLCLQVLDQAQAKDTGRRHHCQWGVGTRVKGRLRCQGWALE